MAKEWFDVKIVDVIDEAYNIKRFFLKYENLDVVDFVPGQYIQLELPITSKKTYRQYSIANIPDGSNILELLIVLDPDGVATNYLFHKAKIGDVVKASKVMGNFKLPVEIEDDICFICTGVGLAPLRSMYLNILKNNLPHKDIYVIYGTRFLRDLAYNEEFEKLQAEFPEFKYIPVLSRESDENWSGKKGYVHSVYQEIFADRRRAYFMLCGWKGMITEARQNLMQMGYNRRDIHFERYN